jgi:hypothetical protein
VESRDDRLTRFDLVFKADYCGQTQYNPGAPRGKFPFAVSLRLSDDPSEISKTPPGATRSGLGRYWNP